MKADNEGSKLRQSMRCNNMNSGFALGARVDMLKLVQHMVD
jgi:hypothetical protein